MHAEMKNDDTFMNIKSTIVDMNSHSIIEIGLHEVLYSSINTQHYSFIIHYTQLSFRLREQ